MSEMSREELLRAEAIGSEQGWVAPMTQEDKGTSDLISPLQKSRKGGKIEAIKMVEGKER